MDIETMEMDIEHIQRYANQHNITFDEAKEILEDEEDDKWD